ncbi:unnamed protein product [Amoebophrya sp. A25]|nr:unnamed protein product [Amoebophrya sp. A25]|eukprot:GSA25T00015469001.1
MANFVVKRNMPYAPKFKFFGISGIHIRHFHQHLHERGRERPPRICVLGDELSGLSTAYLLQQRLGRDRVDVFVIGFEDGSARRCGMRSEWVKSVPQTSGGFSGAEDETEMRGSSVLLEKGMYGSILSNRAGREALGLVKRLGIEKHLRLADPRESSEYLLKLERRNGTFWLQRALSARHIFRYGFSFLADLVRGFLPWNWSLLFAGAADLKGKDDLPCLSRFVRARFGSGIAKTFLDPVVYATFGIPVVEVDERNTARRSNQNEDRVEQQGLQFALSTHYSFPRLLENAKRMTTYSGSSLCSLFFPGSVLAGGVLNSLFSTNSSWLCLRGTDPLLLQVLHKKGRCFSFYGGLEYLAKALEWELIMPSGKKSINDSSTLLRSVETQTEEPLATKSTSALRILPGHTTGSPSRGGGGGGATMRFPRSMLSDTEDYGEKLNQEMLAWEARVDSLSKRDVSFLPTARDSRSRKSKFPEKNLTDFSENNSRLFKLRDNCCPSNAQEEGKVLEIPDIDCIVSALPPAEFAKLLPPAEEVDGDRDRESDSGNNVVTELRNLLNSFPVQKCAVVSATIDMSETTMKKKKEKKTLFRGGGYYAASSSLVSAAVFQTRLFPNVDVNRTNNMAESQKTEVATFFVPSPSSTEGEDVAKSNKPSSAISVVQNEIQNFLGLVKPTTPDRKTKTEPESKAERSRLSLSATSHKYGYPIYEHKKHAERLQQATKLARQVFGVDDFHFVGRNFHGPSPAEEIVDARKIVDKIATRYQRAHMMHLELCGTA